MSSRFHSPDGVRRGDHDLVDRDGLRPFGRRLGVDSFATYNWLLLGSFAVGLGAVAIALAFPPLPARQSARWQPA